VLRIYKIYRFKSISPAILDLPGLHFAEPHFSSSSCHQHLLKHVVYVYKTSGGRFRLMVRKSSFFVDNPMAMGCVVSAA